MKWIGIILLFISMGCAKKKCALPIDEVLFHGDSIICGIGVVEPDIQQKVILQETSIACFDTLGISVDHFFKHHSFHLLDHFYLGSLSLPGGEKAHIIRSQMDYLNQITGLYLENEAGKWAKKITVAQFIGSEGYYLEQKSILHRNNKGEVNSIMFYHYEEIPQEGSENKIKSTTSSHLWNDEIREFTMK